MSARAIRTRKGDVQTATCLYQHPDTGHRIGVIGTIHVGDSSYFDDLRDVIDQWDGQGWAVQYEFIRRASDAEKAAASAEDVAALGRFRAVGKATKVMADLLGLPTQHRWLPMPEHWRNVDVSDLDVIRAHPDQRFLEEVERMVESLEAFDERQKRVTRWLLLFAVRHMRGVELLSKLLQLLRLKPPGLRKEFVLDHRNRLAVEAAVGESPRSVVTVWGAGHLPGIHRLLTGQGYIEGSRTWMTAVAS